MNERATLTEPDVRKLHTILEAATNHSTITWETESGSVLRGVARRVDRYDGETYSGGDDIRDQFLHVSSTMEHWFPIHQVLAKVADGSMAIRSS